MTRYILPLRGWDTHEARRWLSMRDHDVGDWIEGRPGFLDEEERDARNRQH